MNKQPWDGVERRKMARYLSQLDGWALAFGCIVGWGAFVMPGTTFLPVAGPLGTIIAMVLSAVIMVVIGSNYSYLMIRRPGTGGIYSYTKEAFGRDHAFLCSWFLSLSYISIVFLNATALFVVSRTLFGSRMQFGFHYQVAGYDVYGGEVLMSALVLAVVGILFILKKPLLQHLQTILAVILLLGALGITLICLPQVDMNEIFAFGLGNHNTVTVVMTIVLLSPWAFVGFDVISLETAHFRFPKQKSKRIVFLSILMGAFIYIAMSVVSIVTVPDGYGSWQEYIGELESLTGVHAVPTFHAAWDIIGVPGLVIMCITALAAILTGVIGAYRATTRVLSTMAEDSILTPKFLNTSFCITFIMIISILISFLGRNALNWFVELTTFGAIIGFGYSSASSWKFARAEGDRKHQVSGFIGTLITLLFAIVQLIPRITIFETMGPQSFMLLAMWCLLGFVFYWRTMRKSVQSEYRGVATSSTVLFCLLLYSGAMWFVQKMMEIRDPSQIQDAIIHNGIILLVIAGIGLTVMIYIQRLMFHRHEKLERDIIRAEESSLAKTRFLFNMSHDIRTPMNAIIGYTDAAIKENQDPKVGDHLFKIKSSSRHLMDLIDDILEMSRIESGKLELEPEPEDLNRILEEMQTLFESRMREKQLDFTVDASGVVHPYVYCDKKRLNRVLFNIISNAYKFTPEGGSIRVTLSETAGEGPESSSYQLSIRDTGIGMSSEFAAKVFTAFERERTSTVSGIQGTGLGMAITKSIVDMMGGTIEVHTAPGKGTEFVVNAAFPLAGREEVEKEEDREEENSWMAADFSGMRLLLVEDNEVNREIAAMMLQEMGFQLDHAENGKIAVEKIRDSLPGEYDGVLMDVQMPVMDGYTATKKIRELENEELAAIPIIAMTANAFKEDEQAALAAGMQAHIAKPLDMEKVWRTLAEVFQKTGQAV